MKQTRLYNVIFPIWLLFLFPAVWLVVVPANLLIDCAVVLLALIALRHTQKKAVLKQVWWGVWIMGFASDFVGALFLLPSMFLLGYLPEPWDSWLEPVMYNPFKSWLAFAVTLIAVALSGVCIYFLNQRGMRSCAELTDRERHVVSLTLAIVTAPWTFFIPMY